jgi:gamma-glutamyltranspeptidase / glutathione hydrolase
VTNYPDTREIFRRPTDRRSRPATSSCSPISLDTRKLIAEQGVDVFYRGPIAEAIVAGQQRHVAAGRGGLMTLRTSPPTTSRISEPVEDDYRGYTVKSMGPPSSGGLTVLQMLKMLERFPIGDEAAGYGFGATNTLARHGEAMRLAYADRAVWMGDEDFVPVPKKGLLADEYVGLRSAMISETSRMATPTAGDPWAYEPMGIAGNQPGQRREPHDALLDRGPLGQRRQLHHHDRGRLGHGHPRTRLRHPAQQRADRLQPHTDLQPRHRQPRGERRGRREAAAKQHGAHHAVQGRQAVRRVRLAWRRDDHQLGPQHDPQPAGPRHVDPGGRRRTADVGHLPVGTIAREAGFPAESIAGLQALGHPVNNPTSIGSVQAVVIDLHTGKQYGAADARREGTVIGLPRPRGQRGG